MISTIIRASLVYSCVACTLPAQTQRVVFSYAGAEQTWTVPSGVTSIRIDARGGQGGSNGSDPLAQGGKGGRVQTTLAVTPGETLFIYVGGQGQTAGPDQSGPGGFNGGGNGGTDPVDHNDVSSGGGGASDIRQGADDLAHRVVVAAGGGGAECCDDGVGGNGGGLSGSQGGSSGYSTPGGGGTQVAGGTGGSNGGTSGSLGQGGNGGSDNRPGGGGGSGYYGGGGGGGAFLGSGGGGGSSYSTGTRTIHTSGYQSGNGKAIISFAPTLPFLTFPLPNRYPSNANIISVFDHSSAYQYCADNIVTAFDGEQGNYGDDGNPTNSYCSLTHTYNLLYGWSQQNGAPFSINGQYVGDGSTSFLEYDGHPGFDYETLDQDPSGNIPVLAAADGVVVCSNVPTNCFDSTTVDPCVEGPGEIKIKHPSGYFSIYLHLSSSLVAAGATVTSQQQIGVSGATGTPGCASPHLHFELREGPAGCSSKSTCVCSRKQTGKTSCIPVDPYGWSGTGKDPYNRAININLWK